MDKMDNRNCRDFYDFNEREDEDENQSDYLGEGGYAIVYKAIKKGTREKRALKIIKKRKIKQILKESNKREPTDEDMNSFYNDLYKEIEFMKLMEGKNGQNKNTVKFYEKFHNNFEFVIVMELCDENLDDFLIRKKHFNADEIYNILTQINKSFKIMNQLKIVHRDLNLKNILVKYENKEKTKYILKISDYGISKEMIDISKLHTQKGTLRYMAPQVIEGKYNEKCDLWSLGIIIYLLYFKDFPYNGEDIMPLYNQIKELDINVNTDNDDLNDLIRSLLNSSEEHRLNWNQYYNHRFFTNNANQIIEEEKEENAIIIKVNVRNVDKNGNEIKDIYFLDNDLFMKEKTGYNYKENEEIKKLLEEGSIEIFINDNDLQDYKKYFKPKNEGIYEIKLNFKKKMTDCSYMFSGCLNIISIDLSSFDSSQVTNMHYMFGKCKYLEEINLENLNTENVTDMGYMFNSCFNLKKIIFPKSFNTKHVKNLSNMFCDCQHLSEIKFSPSFQTNNVVSMINMFGNCHNLIKLDLTNFDTSNVENMFKLFNGCNNLEEILINKSIFITDKTKDMSHMFNNCEKLKNIPISYFNSKNAKFLNYIFSNCKAVTNLDLSNFIIKDKANISHMLDGCSNLTELNISSFMINKDIDIYHMLDNLGKIQKIIVNENSVNFFKQILKDKESVFSIA